MTEKRYFSIDYDEEYYIFDSTKISKEEVLEKAEYSYDVFGDSLMENEVLDLLNEQDIEIKRLKEELFEARKDYIVDTADISDKTYLDEMIEEERKEIYGDVE